MKEFASQIMTGLLVVLIGFLFGLGFILAVKEHVYIVTYAKVEKENG